MLIDKTVPVQYFIPSNSFICKEHIEEYNRLFFTYYQKRCLTDSSIGPQIKTVSLYSICFSSLFIETDRII